MKIFKVIPRVSWLLVKSFLSVFDWNIYLEIFIPYSILQSKFFNDFSMTLLNKGFKFFNPRLGELFETLFAFTFLGISAFQAFLFAMYMDIQDNEKLYK